MQVNADLVRACPFLTESDRLSLSPELMLGEGVLQDIVLSIPHALTSNGVGITQLIADDICYKQLLQQAKQLQVKDIQLSELLGFLNTIGGLRIMRASLLRTGALKTRYLLIGFHFAPLSHRYRISLSTLCVAILRATTPVFLATGVVSGLIWAAGLGAFLQTIQVTGAALALFFASILVHEGAHIWVLNRGQIQANILQRGMHLGLIHAAPPRSIDIVSSLAGPLAGAIIGIAAAMHSVWRHSSILVLVSTLVSLLHLLSLLPLYGDGRSLKNALAHKESV